MLRSCLVCLALSCLCGCLPDAPHRAPTADASGDSSAGQCLPVLSGELIINEIMARPAGLDLDGDGRSNSRDEALELVLDSEADSHLGGATLWIDGQLRGRILPAPCLSPGIVIVLTGPSTAHLDLPAGAVQLALDHSLGLGDGGGSIELRGTAGNVLGQASYPAEEGGPPSSRTRTLDGQRNAPLVAHRGLPAAAGAPWSIGRCATGLEPCTCISALSVLCDRGR